MKKHLYRALIGLVLIGVIIDGEVIWNMVTEGTSYSESLNPTPVIEKGYQVAPITPQCSYTTYKDQQVVKAYMACDELDRKRLQWSLTTMKPITSQPHKKVWDNEDRRAARRLDDIEATADQALEEATRAHSRARRN